MPKITALFFLFFLFTTVLTAQILNVEKRRGNVSKNGWKGNIDFSGKYTQNTKKIFEVYNKTALNYKKDLKSYLILTDLKLIKKDKEDLINKGVIHLRYMQQLGDSSIAHLELFTQHQFNAVQKIKLRSLLGGGYRFKLLGNDTINCNIGIGGMYEHEASTVSSVENVFRMTSYISFNWDILQKWKFRLITYYQPKITEGSDYRISNETSLSYRVSKQFSIVTVFSSLYDTQPIKGIPEEFYTGSLLFRYVF